MTFDSQCNEVSSSTDQLTIQSSSCYIFNYVSFPVRIDFMPGTYIIDLYGASGGFSTFGSINQPGKGGTTSGVTKFKKLTHLYLRIGGMGGNSSNDTPGSGGFNGGVGGGRDLGDYNCASGGSGGATDIRTDSSNIFSRIMVAAGGGSPGCYTTAGRGGNGGGVEGEDGLPTVSGILGGKGGSQINGYSVGSGGAGEDGVTPVRGEAGGSGGGGYWGGFGGKTTTNSKSGSGGGGGSSFISGYPDCISFNEDGSLGYNSVHYSNIVFSNGILHSRNDYGPGYAFIRGIHQPQHSHCSEIRFFIFIFAHLVNMSQ